MPLAPCIQCQRHVKASEAVCPFCAAVLPQAAPSLPVARKRTSRAAMVLAAITVAASAGGATGCKDDDDDEEDMQVQPIYGAPTEDGGMPDAGETDKDAGGQAMPVYGIAPEEDGGGQLMPVYGIAPEEDGGVPDAGGDNEDAGGQLMPVYGIAAEDK